MPTRVTWEGWRQKMELRTVIHVDISLGFLILSTTGCIGGLEEISVDPRWPPRCIMFGVLRRTFSLAGVHSALPATTTDPRPLLLLPPSTPPSGSYDFARCRPCPLWAAVLLPATDSRIACVHLAPDTYTWSVQSRLRIYFFW